MFAYHWLTKVDKDQWDRLGAQLGTTWKRSELERLDSTPAGAKEGSDTIFVPLSLVINQDLVEGLLNRRDKPPGQPSTGSTPATPQAGDGLHTGMALPSGEEVVNMATLPKDEFLNVIRAGGLPTERAK
jgi:hypothetical protein